MTERFRNGGANWWIAEAEPRPQRRSRCQSPGFDGGAELADYGEHPQGCSMHSTEGHCEHGFDASDRGGEAVLRDRVGLIAAQDIVGEAAQSGEDPRIFSDLRGILA